MSAQLALAAALVLAQSNQSTPDVCLANHNWSELGDAYVSCVRSETLRLERSGETAESVAVAVVVACREQGLAEATVSAECYGIDDREAVEKEEALMHDAVIKRVVEIRAARTGAMN
jgi:hypothetical protein